jgi:hypothetical protein
MVQPEHSGDPGEIVVFSIVRDSECSECHAELWKGALLRMENGRPLCMSCADLDRLVFLPSGDAALTRRSKKHSSLWAVVVRFSRSRQRYERQGVLVEQAALERAEQECVADAPARAAARARAKEHRTVAEQEYVTDFARHLAELYPHAPGEERVAIAEHACSLGSGRVGRSAAAKHFEPAALELAVRAHIRHRHTGYEALLGRGLEREEARSRVRDRVAEILGRWRGEADHPAGELNATADQSSRA